MERVRQIRVLRASRGHPSSFLCERPYPSFSNPSPDTRSMANPSPRFLRSIISRARLLLTDVTPAELLAEDATRTRPWPPKDTTALRLISRASFEFDEFLRVANLLHKRLERFDRKRWRKAYKSLILVEHLLTHGALSFADELQSCRGVLEQMRGFQYVDEMGFDWGLTVKKKAERVLKLLEKGPFLHEERYRLRRATWQIQGFDGFSIDWPSTSRTPHCGEQDDGQAAKSDSDAGAPPEEKSDGQLLLIEDRRKVHPSPAEESMPLLSCEEGREIELLSDQF